MQKFIVLSLFLSLFFACKNDPSQQTSTEAIKGGIINHTNVLLLCQPAGQTDDGADAPTHEVFLQMAENKMKVADILNCETLSPAVFEQYQIPKQAITAVGGWWAGAGDYLYIVEEGDYYVVKQGAMYEEKTDSNYDYKVVAKYTKAGQQVFD